MTLSPSALRRAAALAAALLLGACSAGSGCDETSCGAATGTVTSVAGDGSRTWTAAVRDTGATVLVQDDVVVVDGCRAVTVLDAATGQVLLETVDVEDAGAVVGRVLVGSARRQADAPGLVGVRLDGARGGFSWSKVVGSAGVTPSPVTRVGSGFAVAFGDSLDVVADPVVAADPRTAVQLPSDVVGTPVALSDGVVLAATADGSVYGIRDGALRWRVVPELVGARVSTALTAVAEGALVSSSTGRDESETSFVDPEGTVRWRTHGWLPEGSVVPATAKVAVLTTGTSTSAHDLRTGMRRWTAPAAEAGTPVLTTEAAVATTERQQDGSHVVARDPLTGRTLWERTGTVAGPAGPSALLVRGTGDEPGAETVSALDAATGDVLWVLPVTSGAPTSATIPASDAAPAATLVVDVPSRPMVTCE